MRMDFCYVHVHVQVHVHVLVYVHDDRPGRILSQQVVRVEEHSIRTSVVLSRFVYVLDVRICGSQMSGALIYKQVRGSLPTFC